MSDSNSDRKAAARQANASSSSPDYFGSMRENMKMSGYYGNQGLIKSANHYANSVSTTGPAQSKLGTAGQVASAIAVGGKEWGQAAKYGIRAAGDWSKGALNGFINYANHGSNPVANYNNMRMYQAMAPQGRNSQQNKVSDTRTKAGQVKQNSGYKPKANQPAVNKGIEAFRQKSSAKQTAPNTGKSTNKGIASFESKAGGQPAGTSKSGERSTTKGANESKGKSGGSSSGGKSSGGQER